MAADYATEIRRVQPHGPYFIAAHSFGGLVGFEIAQQLVREGERVSFLGLIDTGLRNPPVETSRLSAAVRVSSRVHGFFDKLRWIRHVVLKRWYNLNLRLGGSIPYDIDPLTTIAFWSGKPKLSAQALPWPNHNV